MLKLFWWIFLVCLFASIYYTVMLSWLVLMSSVVVLFLIPFWSFPVPKNHKSAALFFAAYILYVCGSAYHVLSESRIAKPVHVCKHCMLGQLQVQTPLSFAPSSSMLLSYCTLGIKICARFCCCKHLSVLATVQPPGGFFIPYPVQSLCILTVFWFRKANFGVDLC